MTWRYRKLFYLYKVNFVFVSKTIQRILKKQGIDFKMNTKVTKAEKTDSGIQVSSDKWLTRLMDGCLIR